MNMIEDLLNISYVARQWRHHKWDPKRSNSIGKHWWCYQKMSIILGSKGEGPEHKKQALDKIKEAKDFDSIGWNIQKMSMWGIKAEASCKCCGTVHPRDSALPTAKHEVDAARWITLGWCPDQCRGNSKARSYQWVVDQSLRSGRMKGSIHYSRNNINRSLDLVNIKYHEFDHMKSITFTNLESSTS